MSKDEILEKKIKKGSKIECLLAEKFDNMIYDFTIKHFFGDMDITEEFILGWIDYKHSKMGELEQKLKYLIKAETKE
jgi:hypothetical protein